MLMITAMNQGQLPYQQGLNTQLNTNQGMTNSNIQPYQPQTGILEPQMGIQPGELKPVEIKIKLEKKQWMMIIFTWIVFIIGCIIARSC